MPHATTLDRIAHVLDEGRHLSATAHRVLLVLLVHADRTGTAWPSLGRIATLAGCDGGSARRALRELGPLVATRRRRNSSSVRTVAPGARVGDLARMQRGPAARGGAVGVGAPAAPDGERDAVTDGPQTVHRRSRKQVDVGGDVGEQSAPSEGGAVAPSQGGLTRPPERNRRTIEESNADVQIPHRWAGGGRSAWAQVTADLLETPGPLLDALRRAGPMSESAELRALAAAHTAIRAGRNPCALFVSLAKNKGASIPLADEDAGRRDWMQLQGRTPEPRQRRDVVRVSAGARVYLPARDVPAAVPIGDLLKEFA